MGTAGVVTAIACRRIGLTRSLSDFPSGRTAKVLDVYSPGSHWDCKARRRSAGRNVSDTDPKHEKQGGTVCGSKEGPRSVGSSGCDWGVLCYVLPQVKSTRLYEQDKEVTYPAYRESIFYRKISPTDCICLIRE